MIPDVEGDPLVYDEWKKLKRDQFSTNVVDNFELG